MTAWGASSDALSVWVALVDPYAVVGPYSKRYVVAWLCALTFAPSVAPEASTALAGVAWAVGAAGRRSIFTSWSELHGKACITGFGYEPPKNPFVVAYGSAVCWFGFSAKNEIAWAVWSRTMIP